MAKFYVQCGTRSLIIEAIDAHAAAMHLVDLAMQPHLWIYDDAGLDDADRQDHLMMEALLHLAPSIRVSEQGLDRADAREIGTPETVLAWHQTMAAVTRMMAAAGLAVRPAKQLATVGNSIQWMPLRPIRKGR